MEKTCQKLVSFFYYQMGENKKKIVHDLFNLQLNRVRCNFNGWAESLATRICPAMKWYRGQVTSILDRFRA